MNWFIWALIATFAWGGADLFYASGSDEKDRYSHLKIAVWVGIVMGAFAFALMPLSETIDGPGSVLNGMFLYSPASLCYIISMVIGYAGLRYLELSIISPIQNASGAFSMICMLLFFVGTGQISNISDAISPLDLVGTILIVIGVIAIGIVKNKDKVSAKHSKYRLGALALMFPILYCIFDTAGTALDGIILAGGLAAELGEIDVIILYGLTFSIAGIVAWIYIRVRTGKFYNPFSFKEKDKCFAALCEEAGQIAYVYAMMANPLVAAPMIACYCVISMLLARVFLKEKLSIKQYICIAFVVVGILLLGISEGINS